MNKKIIKTIGSGVILAIIVGLGWSLVNKDGEKQDRGQKRSFDTVVIEEEIRESEPVVRKAKPKEISWQIREWVVASKVLVGEAEVLSISDEKLEGLAKDLGIDWSTKDEGIEGLIVFSGGEDEKELVVDMENKNISFAKMVFDINDENNRISKEKIENKFFELVGKVVDRESVVIEKISYKKLVYPRWIDSSSQNAEALEIKANYNVNKLKVRGYEWETVKMIMGVDGEVLKLELNWPMVMGEAGQEFEVKSFNEVQSLALDEFLVLSIEGDEEYELGMDQEKVEEIQIFEVELAYIYNSNDGLLVPYLLFSGQAKSGEMEVDVLLGLKAIK